MPCYRPNIRVANYNIRNAKTGSSTTYQFINSLGDKIMRYKDGTVNYEWYEQMNEEMLKRGFEYQQVPCGQCVGCREATTKEWAIRCVLESYKWSQNWFITLTYDDYHLPWDDQFVNTQTGEIYEDDGTWGGYLVPKDLQDFWKRLRRNYQYHDEQQDIRYFACGEYGTKGQRPHYHAIIFNLNIAPEDLRIRSYDKESGKPLYTSPRIEKIWGKGFITIEEFDYNSAAYVAGYVQKKKYSMRDYNSYAKLGQTPEFTRMSTRGGIGLDYYNNHPEMYENDEIIIKGSKQKIVPAKIPRYFDKKREDLYPEEMKKLKEKRKNKAINNQKIKMLSTDLVKSEQLKIEEKEKLKKIKSLKRDKTESSYGRDLTNVRL